MPQDRSLIPIYVLCGPGLTLRLRPNAKAPPAKGGAWWHRRPVLWCNKSGKQDLQGGLNLESPGLKQGLRDVLRILVSPSPLPQPRRADILIGSQLEFLNHLFERGYGGNDRSDRLRLAPIWISTTLCHLLSVPLPVLFLRNPCFERGWVSPSVAKITQPQS